jgi:hypothetical protein
MKLKFLCAVAFIVIANGVFAYELSVKGLNPDDKVYIRRFDNNNLITSTLNSTNNVFVYDDALKDIKVKIKKVLPSGEYIERVHVLKNKDEDIYMVTLGFFETDRKELDSLVARAVRRIEHKQGKLRETKIWLIKALKNLHVKP